MTNCVTMPSYHTQWTRAWLCAVLVSGAAAPWLVRTDDAQAQQAPARAQRGWLGIVMDELPGGKVLVKEVLRGSPAEKARLLPGDLLLRVNGAAVRTAHETARSVGRHGAGAVVRVAFSRAGSVQTVGIRLEPFPSGEQMLRMQHVGRPAPALQGLLTPAGAAGPSLASFRGKVLVLDFWASFCIACRVTAVHMNGWHQRYANRGLHVLGIAGEAPEVVTRGAQRFGMRYPTCADPDMTTSAAYHVQELPSLMVIDRNGVVRDVATGYDPDRMREMEALVERLLAEPAPATP
jgi:peroxiredoxin